MTHFLGSTFELLSEPLWGRPPKVTVESHFCCDLIVWGGEGQQGHKLAHNTELGSCKLRRGIGGSLVGVWNGWGYYGIAIFRALNFHSSKPKLGDTHSFCGITEISSRFRLLSNIFWTLESSFRSRHLPEIPAIPQKERPSPSLRFRARKIAMPYPHPNPKDPSVLKIVRRVNFGTGIKFGTDVAKRYGEGSEVLVFLGKRGRKMVRILKNYGGGKIVRIRAPYYF